MKELPNGLGGEVQILPGIALIRFVQEEGGGGTQHVFKVVVCGPDF